VDVGVFNFVKGAFMNTKKQIVILLILIIAAMSMTASRPILTVRAQGELPEGQLMIIGIVASTILWLLKVLVSKGYDPSKEVVAIALYVISFVLAVVFTPIAMPSFPPFTDAPTFISALLTYIGLLSAVASPIVGLAYLIYNVLLKRVLESAKAAVLKK
jgi:hypothetical protein